MSPSSGGTWREILRNLGEISPHARGGEAGDAMAARIGQAAVDCDEWLKPQTKFPRYPLCVISRRASSRPARASHAAAAASAVGCAHATRGVDCAAREPCRRRGFDRDHVGTRHRRPAEPDRPPTNKTAAMSCVSRARGAADRRRRGWRRKSATGADPSRAGRRLGLDDPASAKRAVANGRPSDGQRPHLPSRTFLRSHRSCSRRSRWPPAFSIRLDCRPAA